MHYYNFHIADYISHTTHLDLMEDLAYRRMIDWCYLNEAPLPDNIDEIAKRICMRTHSDCIVFVLNEFFVLTKKGYEQKRITDELKKYKNKSEKAKKSANARWNDKKPIKSTTSANASAMRTHNERNANQQPITKNQEPITKNQQLITNNQEPTTKTKIYESSFNEFWETYPKKSARLQAKKSWLKLKPNDALVASIIASVELFKTSNEWTKDDGQYVPNASTWLNNERWTDQLTYNTTKNNVYMSNTNNQQRGNNNMTKNRSISDQLIDTSWAN